jgi:hypothetical protein
MNKKPSNWIQGLSVQERKKQGITTVMSPKKTTKKIHYDAEQVNVEVNHSHMDKLRILHMTMHLWVRNNIKVRNNSQVPKDSQQGKLYESDLHKVEELVDEGNVYGEQEFLTKEQMVSMNVLFKTYGGKRVTK